MDQKSHFDKARQGVVNLWKVHGSVDWFRNSAKDKQEIVTALPITNGHPGEQWTPAIILPDNAKYQQAHMEPFRTIMREADTAIANSNSILCIGFGFNDIHILPKLKDRCKIPKTTLVILAEELTPEAVNFFRQCKCHNRMALQKCVKGRKKLYVFT